MRTNDEHVALECEGAGFSQWLWEEEGAIHHAFSVAVDIPIPPGFRDQYNRDSLTTLDLECVKCAPAAWAGRPRTIFTSDPTFDSAYADNTVYLRGVHLLVEPTLLMLDTESRVSPSMELHATVLTSVLEPDAEDLDIRVVAAKCEYGGVFFRYTESHQSPEAARRVLSEYFDRRKFGLEHGTKVGLGWTMEGDTPFRG